MRLSRLYFLSAAAFWCVISHSSLALADQEPDGSEQHELVVPDSLRPWVGWVTYGIDDLECPTLGEERYCVWPGRLSVQVRPDGMTFSYEVWLEKSGELTLPGSADYWPTSVRTEQGPALVGTDADGNPQVFLEAGPHVLSGRIAWSRAPDALRIPADAGSVELAVGGRSIDYPRIEAGQLYLGEVNDEDDGVRDSIRVSVYRRIEDGVPMRVRTRLELNVAGRAREVDLGRILLGATRAIAADGDLPARVQPDGLLTVYVRPGTHMVEVTSVVPEPVETVAVPEPEPGFYDAQEIWVWIPDESIRSVRLEGLSAVDPDRTSLPEDWRGQTTFLAESGESLDFEVIRRGAPEASPNMIDLKREIWLDLDGQGYSLNDSITGTMAREWRLNYKEGVVPGRVRDQNDQTDLLITTDARSGQSGVEIRRSSLNLAVDMRVEERPSRWAIVGLDHDVQSLGATLNLPPGWTLLGGTGVDKMPGTWLDSWSLWDFFFVLMVALALGKLLGWRWTPVALVALVLAHNLDGAPRWVWIHLLVSLALLRVLPDSLWRRIVVVYRAIALIALFVILASFVHDQVQRALHPQIATQVESNVQSQTGERSFEPSPPQDMQEKEDTFEAEKSIGISDMGYLGAAKRAEEQARSKMQQIAPNAVVQTGPGLPTWKSTSWSLQWVGPVRSDHEIALWLVSPLQNTVLAFLRVGFLIAMALILIARRDMYWRRPSQYFGSSILGVLSRSAMMGIAVGFALISFTPEAFSEVPVPVENEAAVPSIDASHGVEPEILAQLKARILEQAECPRCVTVERASISISGQQFRMTATVHARQRAGWSLPGPEAQLKLDQVSLDGMPTSQLRRSLDGLTAVRLPRGTHEVTVVGRLANQNSVRLQFDPDTRPRRVEFSSEGWTLDGVTSDGVPDSSLQLTRTVEASAEADEATEVEPWFEVQRQFNLGLPWQIRTVVSRSSSQRGTLLKFPLMEGEQVITESVRVEDREALVEFGRGLSVVEFVSEIPIQDELTLVAASEQPWTERWTVACSRIWRCDFDGIAPTERVVAEEYQPFWHPWPGEVLNVRVDRPEGAPGQATTIDSVEYTVTPGKRLMQATLKLSVRASQGARQQVTLPDGAELQTVKIDGDIRTLRPEDGVIGLPVRPGSQEFELQWQQPWDRTFVERMPQVLLGDPAANVRTRINLGGDRWLLAVDGPAWGPAILFWSHLIILLIIAILLGRLKNLEVRTWEWLLLAIGISQIPVLAAVPIIGWFFVVNWRREADLEPWWKFDLAQLVLVGLTLVALVMLYAAVHTNLLLDINMQVKGAGSTNAALQWYSAQIESALPTPAIVSVPLLVWRVLMLLWAFWLVSRLFKWARWGWDGFSSGGLWKSPPRGRVDEPKAKTARQDVSQYARAQAQAPVAEARSSTTAATPSEAKSAEEQDADGSEETSTRSRRADRKKHDTVPGAPQPVSEDGVTPGPLGQVGEKTPFIFPPPPDDEEQKHAGDEEPGDQAPGDEEPGEED